VAAMAGIFMEYHGAFLRTGSKRSEQVGRGSGLVLAEEGNKVHDRRVGIVDVRFQHIKYPFVEVFVLQQENATGYKNKRQQRNGEHGCYYNHFAESKATPAQNFFTRLVTRVTIFCILVANGVQGWIGCNHYFFKRSCYLLFVILHDCLSSLLVCALSC
jgi:hypothetical protein